MKKIHLRLAVLVVAACTAFAAIGTAGEPVQDRLGLASHLGEVVVVDFWASWCKPCRQELPWLATMQARHAKAGLTVLTVNLDQERPQADKLLATLGVTLPVVYDPDGALAEAHQIEGMPTSLIYDRDGKLRATRVGFDRDEEDAFEKLLVELLAGGTGDAP